MKVLIILALVAAAAAVPAVNNRAIRAIEENDDGQYHPDPSEDDGQYHNDHSGQYNNEHSGQYHDDSSGQYHSGDYTGDNGRYNHIGSKVEPYVHTPDEIVPYTPYRDSYVYKGSDSGGYGKSVVDGNGNYNVVHKSSSSSSFPHSNSGENVRDTSAFNSFGLHSDAGRSSFYSTNQGSNSFSVTRNNKNDGGYYSNNEQYRSNSEDDGQYHGDNSGNYNEQKSVYGSSSDFSQAGNKGNNNSSSQNGAPAQVGHRVESSSAFKSVGQNSGSSPFGTLTGGQFAGRSSFSTANQGSSSFGVSKSNANVGQYRSNSEDDGQYHEDNSGQYHGDNSGNYNEQKSVYGSSSPFSQTGNKGNNNVENSRAFVHKTQDSTVISHIGETGGLSNSAFKTVSPSVTSFSSQSVVKETSQDNGQYHPNLSSGQSTGRSSFSQDKSFKSSSQNDAPAQVGHRVESSSAFKSVGQNSGSSPFGTLTGGQFAGRSSFSTANQGSSSFGVSKSNANVGQYRSNSEDDGQYHEDNSGQYHGDNSGNYNEQKSVYGSSSPFSQAGNKGNNNVENSRAFVHKTQDSTVISHTGETGGLSNSAFKTVSPSVTSFSSQSVVKETSQDNGQYHPNLSSGQSTGRSSFSQDKSFKSSSQNGAPAQVGHRVESSSAFKSVGQNSGSSPFGTLTGGQFAGRSSFSTANQGSSSFGVSKTNANVGQYRSNSEDDGQYHEDNSGQYHGDNSGIYNEQKSVYGSSSPFSQTGNKGNNNVENSRAFVHKTQDSTVISHTGETGGLSNSAFKTVSPSVTSFSSQSVVKETSQDNGQYHPNLSSGQSTGRSSFSQDKSFKSSSQNGAPAQVGHRVESSSAFKSVGQNSGSSPFGTPTGGQFAGRSSFSTANQGSSSFGVSKTNANVGQYRSNSEDDGQYHEDNSGQYHGDNSGIYNEQKSVYGSSSPFSQTGNKGNNNVENSRAFVHKTQDSTVISHTGETGGLSNSAFKTVSPSVTSFSSQSVVKETSQDNGQYHPNLSSGQSTGRSSFSQDKSFKSSSQNGAPAQVGHRVESSSAFKSVGQNSGSSPFGTPTGGQFAGRSSFSTANQGSSSFGVSKTNANVGQYRSNSEDDGQYHEDNSGQYHGDNSGNYNEQKSVYGSSSPFSQTGNKGNNNVENSRAFVHKTQDSTVISHIGETGGLSNSAFKTVSPSVTSFSSQSVVKEISQDNGQYHPNLSSGQSTGRSSFSQDKSFKSSSQNGAPAQVGHRVESSSAFKSVGQNSGSSPFGTLTGGQFAGRSSFSTANQGSSSFGVSKSNANVGQYLSNSEDDGQYHEDNSGQYHGDNSGNYNEQKSVYGSSSPFSQAGNKGNNNVENSRAFVHKTQDSTVISHTGETGGLSNSAFKTVSPSVTSFSSQSVVKETSQDNGQYHPNLSSGQSTGRSSFSQDKSFKSSSQNGAPAQVGHRVESSSAFKSVGQNSGSSPFGTLTGGQFAGRSSFSTANQGSSSFGVSETNANVGQYRSNSEDDGQYHEDNSGQYHGDNSGIYNEQKSVYGSSSPFSQTGNKGNNNVENSRAFVHKTQDSTVISHTGETGGLSNSAFKTVSPSVTSFSSQSVVKETSQDNGQYHPNLSSGQSTGRSSFSQDKSFKSSSQNGAPAQVGHRVESSSAFKSVGQNSGSSPFGTLTGGQFAGRSSFSTANQGSSSFGVSKTNANVGQYRSNSEDDGQYHEDNSGQYHGDNSGNYNEQKSVYGSSSPFSQTGNKGNNNVENSRAFVHKTQVSTVISHTGETGGLSNSAFKTVSPSVTSFSSQSVVKETSQDNGQYHPNLSSGQSTGRSSFSQDKSFKSSSQNGAPAQVGHRVESSSAFKSVGQNSGSSPFGTPTGGQFAGRSSFSTANQGSSSFGVSKTNANVGQYRSNSEDDGQYHEDNSGQYHGDNSGNYNEQKSVYGSSSPFSQTGNKGNNNVENSRAFVHKTQDSTVISHIGETGGLSNSAFKTVSPSVTSFSSQSVVKEISQDNGQYHPNLSSGQSTGRSSFSQDKSFKSSSQNGAPAQVGHRVESSSAFKSVGQNSGSSPFGTPTGGQFAGRSSFSTANQGSSSFGVSKTNANVGQYLSNSEDDGQYHEDNSGQYHEDHSGDYYSDQTGEYKKNGSVDRSSQNVGSSLVFKSAGQNTGLPFTGFSNIRSSSSSNVFERKNVENGQYYPEGQAGKSSSTYTFSSSVSKTSQTPKYYTVGDSSYRSSTPKSSFSSFSQNQGSSFDNSKKEYSYQAGSPVKQKYSFKSYSEHHSVKPVAEDQHTKQSKDFETTQRRVYVAPLGYDEMKKIHSSLNSAVSSKYGQQNERFDEKHFGIVRKTEKFTDNGYHYVYETENGIIAEEEGRLVKKDAGEAYMEVRGFYSYKGPDNVVYIVEYTADSNNGFVPKISNASKSSKLGRTAGHLFKDNEKKVF